MNKISFKKQILVIQTLYLIIVCSIFLLFIGQFFLTTLTKDIENEKEWIKNYSYTLLNDLKHSKIISVERKLKRLSETYKYNNIILNYGIEKIEIINSEKIIIDKIPFVSTSFNVDIMDKNKTIWANIKIDLNCDQLIKNYIKYYVQVILILIGFVFIFFGIMYIISENISKPIISLVKKLSKNPNKINFSNEIDLLSYVVDENLKNIKEKNEITLKQELLKKQQAISKQIAHDIRSPLEALKMISSDIEGLDSISKTIISTSIGRISDIASGLLNSCQDITDENRLLNLKLLIEDLITNKNFEKNIQINFNTTIKYKDSFILGNENKIYRAVSNLLNNAIECQKVGNEKVYLNLNKFESNIHLEIKDLGPGMSKEFIQKALNGGFTTKRNGNGMGLKCAKEFIEESMGKFQLHSTKEVGSSVKITFPAKQSPIWFEEEIVLNKETNKIVCIDDDISFLELHKEKLKNLNLVILFYSKKDFKNIQFNQKTQYIFDYDLGLNDNGIDLILKNNIVHNSILVTSMYNDVLIQEKCKVHGIKLLPKQVYNRANIIYN